MLINVQRNASDARIRGGQTADRTPFVGKICPLFACQALGRLFKPKIDVFFIHALFHKPPLIDKRHDSVIGNAVGNGVFVNELAEFCHRVLFALHQRRSRKADIAGIGKHGAHLCRHCPVIAAMAFIDKHKNIA